MSEETSYHLIKILEANPETTQRELAREMGISLGKANYCLKGLIDKGIIKAQNFKSSNNKLAYAYLLTPKGIEQKAQITARYLKRRLKEYQDLKQEIDLLQKEVQNHPESAGAPCRSNLKPNPKVSSCIPRKQPPIANEKG